MRDVIVRPSKVAGMIELTLIEKGATISGGYCSGVVLTADQAGALIFGIEQALEVHDVEIQRRAA